jgi:hypothetical protein
MFLCGVTFMCMWYIYLTFQFVVLANSELPLQNKLLKARVRDESLNVKGCKLEWSVFISRRNVVLWWRCSSTWLNLGSGWGEEWASVILPRKRLAYPIAGGCMGLKSWGSARFIEAAHFLTLPHIKTRFFGPCSLTTISYTLIWFLPLSITICEIYSWTFWMLLLSLKFSRCY